MGLSEPGRLSWNRYKSKSSILFLLYLLSPSPSIDRAQPAPSKDSPAISQRLEPGSTSLKRIESDASASVLWTPKFTNGVDLSGKVVSLKELKTVAAKGSSSTTPQSEWSQTPTPSDPPRAQSSSRSQSSPENVGAERKNEQKSTPDAERDPGSSGPAFFSACMFTIIQLHGLFLLQYALDWTKKTVGLALLSNPLPPPFKEPASSPARSKLPLSKRLSRLRWRWSLLWSRCGTTIVRQFLLALCVMSFSILGTIDAIRRGGRSGASELLRIGPIWPLLDSPGPVKNTTVQAPNWVRPYRDIALLELIATGLILINAFSPVLVSLSLVPAAVHAPRGFLSRSTPSLLVPTSYIIPHYLSFALASVSLVQLIVLIVTRNANRGGETAGYHLFSFTTLVFFYSICHQLGILLANREKLERDFERIAHLNQEFTKGRIELDLKPFGGEAEQAKMENLLDELERESCCICFEEEWDDESGFRSRCFLTHCGHQVHAACLYSWFKRQSFCPACHSQIPVLTHFPVQDFSPHSVPGAGHTPATVARE
ncbi:hypothetical protein JCM3766R1_000300 [Sporobolomyces carnicolor]